MRSWIRRKRGSFQKSKNAESPPDPRVRGHTVRRRILSHKEHIEHKEMEGGNGESEANVVTLCSKCATSNDVAENLPWM